MTFLSRQRNDLTESAIQSVPDIQNVLDILALQPDLRLCRMTGSGSACFGIFGSDKTAQDAQLAISRSAPSSWWVRRGVLSSPR